MRIIPYVLMLGALGCASTEKYEAKEIETKLETKQRLDGQVIGIDDEGLIIIQEERTAAAELTRTRLANEMRLDELSYERSELSTCRRDLSDARLGGDGFSGPETEITDLREVVPSREQIGLNESGQLKVVSKRFYRDELESERRFGESLRQVLATTREHRARCEGRLRSARLASGLPAERIKAEGYFTHDGTWVQTRQGERTLDDAFEIMATRRRANQEQQPD